MAGLTIASSAVGCKSGGVHSDDAPFDFRPPPPTVAPPEDGADRGGACDPNYSGCVPVASDVDCRGGRGDGPEYVDGPVQVIGRDVYGLDRNGNGIGCEHR